MSFSNPVYNLYWEVDSQYRLMVTVPSCLTWVLHAWKEKPSIEEVNTVISVFTRTVDVCQEVQLKRSYMQKNRVDSSGVLERVPTF